MKISIIMGVYNEEKNIRRSIESIINQTYENWEFIICDDCSTDKTWEILEEYRAKDNRIKIIKNENNSGLAKSLNNCIKICTGKYIARQDGDDISLENRLEIQMEFLKNNEKYDLVGSNIYTIDNNEEIWGILSYPEKPTKYDLIKTSCFAHNAVIVKKDIIDILGGYDDTALRVEDYDLWFRFYSKGFKGYNIQDCLVKYNLDILDYGKRKYKYRINEFKVRIKGYKINNIPCRYRIFSVKPLVVGLIPKSIMKKIHSKKYR